LVGGPPSSTLYPPGAKHLVTPLTALLCFETPHKIDI